MGKRGPKPTPTLRLAQRGSWRANTRPDEPAVEPATVVLPAPAWIGPKAAEFWPQIAEILVGMGLMAAPYSIALGLLVDAMADYVAYAKEAAESTPTLMSPNGSSYQNPIVGMKNQAWERVLKALREFGLTPSAITGVKGVPDSKPKTGLDRFKLGRG